MGKETGIAWTDSAIEQFAAFPFSAVSYAVGLVVLRHMACRAERDTVADFETNVGVLGERLDVVGFKVAALIVTAPRASKPIATEDGVSPISILRRAARIFVSLGGAILPRIMVAPSLHVWTGAQPKAHLLADLIRAFLAFQRTFFPFLGDGHLFPRFRRVFSTFEGARSPCTVDLDLHSVAHKAICLFAVRSMLIVSEFRYRLPCIAPPASFQAGTSAGKKFFHGETRGTGGNFYRAFGSLSHG